MSDSRRSSATECLADTDGEDIDEYLESIPDGAGCTEIWEYLSERREDDD